VRISQERRVRGLGGLSFFAGGAKVSMEQVHEDFVI
jgi:hypothetical protein